MHFQMKVLLIGAFVAITLGALLPTDKATTKRVTGTGTTSLIGADSGNKTVMNSTNIASGNGTNQGANPGKGAASTTKVPTKAGTPTANTTSGSENGVWINDPIVFFALVWKIFILTALGMAI